MDPQTARWLASPAGQDVLAGLGGYDPERSLAVGERLRRDGLDPELAAAALTQARLRDRATDKLGERGARLLLTQDGLEQATRWEVAARHAERFGRAGTRVVWDIGCGVGSDALAMLDHGLEVVAVEADPGTAELARANLAGSAAQVLVGRAEDVVLPAGSARLGVWLDPARRQPGRTDAAGRTRRTFSLDQLSPSFDEVLRLAGSAPAAGAKLSPGFPHDRVPAGVEAQWTSFAGQALECCLWWGDARERTGRSAQLHTPDGWVVVEATGDEPGAPQGPAPTPEPGAWVYEPDPAVVQAGLVDGLAAAVGARPWDDTGGYLLGGPAEGARADAVGLRRYVVLDVLSPAEPSLRRWVAQTDVGALTIKKRGVPTEPEALRRRLRPRGARAATLLLARVDGRVRALEVAPA